MIDDEQIIYYILKIYIIILSSLELFQFNNFGFKMYMLL